MAMTYRKAGVDVTLGDRASKILYEAARATWHNREGRLGEVLVPFDDFSGLRAIDVSGLPPGTLMNMGFDGVGTKVEIAERTNSHRSVAFDLFAMVCDDAVMRGAEPVVVGSILDVNRLAYAEGDFLDRIRALAEGYQAAANEARVAVVNGELAELGPRVQGAGSFSYNWGAAVVWFARKDRWITGHRVAVGDAVVGLREEGFRSNGISLMRKIWEAHHGDAWHEVVWEGKPLGEWALHPSRIYSRALVQMTGGVEGEPQVAVHGAAHITGGGLPGKLGRALRPSGLGARLDNPFAPPAAMSHCQSCGQVSDREAYQTWHMGQGMAVITPDPAGVIAIANAHGIAAQRIGAIVEEPAVTILSKGAASPGSWLEFPLFQNE